MKNDLIKVCNFPDATILGIQHNLVLILERNVCRLIVYAGKPLSVKNVLNLKPFFQPE